MRAYRRDHPDSPGSDQEPALTNGMTGSRARLPDRAPTRPGRRPGRGAAEAATAPPARPPGLPGKITCCAPAAPARRGSRWTCGRHRSGRGQACGPRTEGSTSAARQRARRAPDQCDSAVSRMSALDDAVSSDAPASI